MRLERKSHNELGCDVASNFKQQAIHKLRSLPSFGAMTQQEARRIYLTVSAHTPLSFDGSIWDMGADELVSRLAGPCKPLKSSPLQLCYFFSLFVFVLIM